MKSIVFNLFAAYLALMFFAYFFSGVMTYYPPRPGYQNSKDYIQLKTVDGQTIYAVYLVNPKAKYTLLLSHGNADDIGYLMPFLRMMHEQGYAVFAYDYHGYGLSGGRPSETNCYRDVDAAYNYLTKVKKISPHNIIVFGHSLGAAVALDLAIRQPVAGLIMQSPFVTAFRVVTRIQILPFDKFNNLKKIKLLKVPVLIIHGTDDKIIPFWHSMKLYQAVVGAKQFLRVERAGHNDILPVAGAQYWQVFNHFIKTEVMKDSSHHE